MTVNDGEPQHIPPLQPRAPRSNFCWLEDSFYLLCFVCGSEEHRAFACPNRAKSSKTEKDRKITFNAAAGEQKQKRLKIDSDWNKYLKRGDKDSDEESDEVHMMISYSCGNFVEEVHMAEYDGYVFLDSCASKRLFIVKDQSVLESFVYSGGSI